MQALDVAGSEMSLFEHRLLVLRQDLQSSAQQVCYIIIFAYHHHFHQHHHHIIIIMDHLFAILVRGGQHTRLIVYSIFALY